MQYVNLTCDHAESSALQQTVDEIHGSAVEGRAIKVCYDVEQLWNAASVYLLSHITHCLLTNDHQVNCHVHHKDGGKCKPIIIIMRKRHASGILYQTNSQK